MASESAIPAVMLAEKPFGSIALLDPDLRRRADVCHKLQPLNLHIEPYDCLEEIPPGSSYTAVFAADFGRGIPELIDAMAQRGCSWPVVAFRDDVQVSRIVAAIRSGAANYLQWPCDPAVVAEALTDVKRLAVAHERKFREGEAVSLAKLLTPREKAILQDIGNGLSSRMIGERLSISIRTVETHRRNLMLKLGAKSLAEIIRISLAAEREVTPGKGSGSLRRCPYSRCWFGEGDD